MITASESGLYVALNDAPVMLPFYISSDGNGNVCDYVDTNGSNVAHYEYGPFGGIEASSGDKKDVFTHRFSTKPFDADTGLVEYELRMYSPVLGRWVSRDPIAEEGGVNLYGFVANAPADLYDALGREAGIGMPIILPNHTEVDEKLKKCLESARFKIEITGSSYGAFGPDNSIKTTISVFLSSKPCDCVCEDPNFKQQAREYNSWEYGAEDAGSPGRWKKDHLNGGTYYDDRRRPGQFHHVMVDSPGIYFESGSLSWFAQFSKQINHKADIRTDVYCTKGSAAGKKIRSVYWGFEIAYFRDHRPLRRFYKKWWPKMSTPQEF